MCQNMDGKFDIHEDMVFVVYTSFQICTFFGDLMRQLFAHATCQLMEE